MVHDRLWESNHCRTKDKMYESNETNGAQLKKNMYGKFTTIMELKKKRPSGVHKYRDSCMRFS